MDRESYDSRMKMFTSPGVTLTALEASGTRITTREYGELIDFEAGCWAAVLGHGRKEITQVLTENAGHLFHTHQLFDTEHPSALVKELSAAAKLKCSYKGTFLSSGSEAVALTVTLAELITGRQRKLSLSISNHGSTPTIKMPRNPMQWTDLEVDECLSCNKGTDCKECGKFNSIDYSQMAAFVFDAGNSAGLVLLPPEKLITFLAEETRHAGGLVIANEITTGFGRTGKWFGFQHYGAFDTEENSPDLIAIGKGLGNGYPISGCLVRRSLAEMIEATDYRYVQSHIDDPMGCLVARKVVEILVKENLVEHGNSMGEYLRSKLTQLLERTGAINEVRGRGMMNVAILSKDHKAKDVFLRLLEKGFFVEYTEAYNLLRFYAALTIERDDIDALCRSLELMLSANSN